jgi:large subunit ribosomal protein L17
VGDHAEMCIIELVDYNTAMLSAKEEAKAKAPRRTRRGAAKKKGFETESTEVSQDNAE